MLSIIYITTYIVARQNPLVKGVVFSLPLRFFHQFGGWAVPGHALNIIALETIACLVLIGHVGMPGSCLVIHLL
jgi:hypothetical protein